ncbi:MAG: hypothetical protein V1873_07335 [Verrucomicrobiota bacterium]
MTLAKFQDLEDNQFEQDLKNLVADRPMKIWLARSNGHRIDTIVSVGTPQPEPIRLFDHMVGFYLLGEGVTPDLLAPIHKLFQDYCRRHKDAGKLNPTHRVVLHFRSSTARWPNRLLMHYPMTSTIDMDQLEGHL